MCRSPHKTSTCSMPAPWRSAFAPFRGSPHEPRATPLAPTSSGFGLPACDRFPDRSAQSRHDAALPRDSSQLPELSRCRTPRGESPEPIAPPTSHPPLDVPPALASAAADHHILHPPAPRSAFDLQRAGVDETAFSTRSSDPSGGLSAAPQRLPRPLSAEQDQLLQQEFLQRNDLGSNTFLLIRHTGMRIGECADLSFDCLRSTAPDQWAIHVPLGKLKTERMVPVDASVCELVQRLRFFRSLDPRPHDGRLLARPRTKEALVRQLRDYLHQVCHALGLSTRIVPHQLRHTYATEMLRAGVSFPALMKLLGHTSPDMTMLYVEVALNDLQREFQLARSKPRHLVPQPKARLAPIRAGDRFSARCSTGARDVPPHAVQRHLTRLPRLTLQPAHQDRQRSAQTRHTLKTGRDWPVKPTFQAQL